MFDTVEPIEAAIFLAAIAALIASAIMLAEALDVWGLTQRGPIRILAWMRVRNEATRLLISAGVTYAGWLQVTGPYPAAPSVYRGALQVVWLVIAVGCLVQTILNYRDTRRVIRDIERERERAT